MPRAGGYGVGLTPVPGACEDKPVLLHQGCSRAGRVNIRLLTQRGWGVWELGLRGTVRV